MNSDAFLDFAEKHGFALFPVVPSTKKPALAGGWGDLATDNRQQWEQWIADGHGLAIYAKASHLLIVDVDVKHVGIEAAGPAWCAMAAELGIDPARPHMYTPSGGWHYWVRLPPSPPPLRGVLSIPDSQGHEFVSIRYVAYGVALAPGYTFRNEPLTDASPNLVARMQSKPDATVVPHSHGAGLGDCDFKEIEAQINALLPTGYFDGETKWLHSVWAIRRSFGDAGWPLAERISYADYKERLARDWAREDPNKNGPSAAMFEGPARRAGWSKSEMFAPALASVAHKISATPFVWVDPATIPQRGWIYGNAIIRKHLSVTVATAGTGKSTKKITDALAMASGRTLLHDKPHGKFRVWLWNGEDPYDELQRRIAAAALHHKLATEDFAERLFVDSGRRYGNSTRPPGRQEGDNRGAGRRRLDKDYSANHIDVVVIDPFVSSHSVGENDNNAIDLVTKMWAKIADATDCAVDLVHHPRKTGGDAIDAEDARGASALIATARIAETLNVMTAEEATKAGIENRFPYVRVDNAKANLAPREDRARWLKIENIPLGNGWLGWW